jgi:hypothetical protein
MYRALPEPRLAYRPSQGVYVTVVELNILSSTADRPGGCADETW